ncbi:MAG: hypothetical protein Q3979_06880 [Actinomycetaceae bacterium]|nr:hypothetical protein [Actinomycetaceae bacterium]
MSTRSSRNDEPVPHDRAPQAEGDATDRAMTGRGRLSREAHGASSRLRIAGVLAASLLAAASLTACSLNAADQPTGPTNSQTQETDDRDPTNETDEPSDETSDPTESDDPTGDESPTETSDSLDVAHLCGGLIPDEFLTDELSFTSSSDELDYWNRPPDNSSSGVLLCRLEDDANGTSVDLAFEGSSEVNQRYITEAESNDGGRWQPLTIDGQEGDGWVYASYSELAAVWVYPDGASMVLVLSGTTITDSSFTGLVENLVGTIREHNRAAGLIRQSQD